MCAITGPGRREPTLCFETRCWMLYDEPPRLQFFRPASFRWPRRVIVRVLKRSLYRAAQLATGRVHHVPFSVSHLDIETASLKYFTETRHDGSAWRAIWQTSNRVIGNQVDQFGAADQQPDQAGGVRWLVVDSSQKHALKSQSSPRCVEILIDRCQNLVQSDTAIDGDQAAARLVIRRGQRDRQMIVALVARQSPDRRAGKPTV